MAKKSNKQDRFAVWVPCKGYVKRWLLANFNRPDEYWQELVNLSPNREFADDFKRGSRVPKHGAIVPSRVGTRRE